MKTLDRLYPNWSELTIHESSPSRIGASALLRKACKKYTPTQYFPNKTRGETFDSFRNENLESQTFADESFDLVITQDVFEHVYHPAPAFAEIARTLKPGGAHVFTVPLINKHKSTEVWALLGADGSPRFLHEPEIHGNPVDPRGSPVTMHWGYDIVEFIRRHSGLDTDIEHIDDLAMGIRAEYIEVLVTRKPLF